MLLNEGHPREALGLLVQQRLGLRPSELLRIAREHFSVEASDPQVPAFVLIRLGARVGTKVKRGQFAILRERDHPDIYALWISMLGATAVGERLVPTSYGAYARLIRAAEQALGLQVG